MTDVRPEEHPSYWDPSTLTPSEYEADLQRGYQLSLDAIAESPTWVPHSTQHGISIFTRSFPGTNVQATKGVGVVSAPALLTMVTFGDATHRKQWDPMVESSCELRRIDRLTGIAYSSFRAPWPVSKREMIVVGRGQREPDGSFLCYASSVRYPELAVRPGYIRATLFYYAVMATPLPPDRDGGECCRVTFVACSDPLGTLPRVLVNAASVLQPLNVHRVAVMLYNRPQLRREIVQLIAAKMREQGFTDDAAVVAATPRRGRLSKDGGEEEVKEGASTEPTAAKAD